MVRFGIVMLALGLASVLPVQGMEPDGQEKDLVALGIRLGEASSAKEMDVLARSAAEQRSLFVGRLIKLLQTSGSKDAKIRACYLLGEFRAERAVDEVLKHIDLKAEAQEDAGKISLWSLYPCVDALSHIGKPAEKAILELISTSDKKESRDLALRALVHIEGRKVARVILEEQLSRASAGAADRLKAALKDFKE